MGADCIGNNSRMKKYLLYHLRWQISGIAMLPIMVIMNKYPLYISIPVAQLIGAVLFWMIDKWIFKNEEEN